MARLSGGLWPVHDDLQPVQSLEPARPVAQDLRSADRPQRHLRSGRDRQHSHQGSPLRGRRKRGAFEQALGKSRGGRTSKLHALTDDQGRPRVLILTAGNTNDITVAAQLIERAGPIRRLLADKAYDANHLRHLLAEQRIEAVIPSTTSRNEPIAYDAVAYKERNRIERLWCRIKDWRRIATRYDKLARNYLSGVYLAATLICWIN
jgi:transposase